MTVSARQVVRVLGSALLAVPSAVLVLLCGLYLHVKIYALLNPGAVKDMEHNPELYDQLVLHAKFAEPVLYILWFALYWRLFRKWSQSA